MQFLLLGKKLRYYGLGSGNKLILAREETYYNFKSFRKTIADRQCFISTYAKSSNSDVRHSMHARIRLCKSVFMGDY